MAYVLFTKQRRTVVPCATLVLECGYVTRERCSWWELARAAVARVCARALPHLSTVAHCPSSALALCSVRALFTILYYIMCIVYKYNGGVYLLRK